MKSQPHEMWKFFFLSIHFETQIIRIGLCRASLLYAHTFLFDYLDWIFAN